MWYLISQVSIPKLFPIGRNESKRAAASQLQAKHWCLGCLLSVQYSKISSKIRAVSCKIIPVWKPGFRVKQTSSQTFVGIVLLILGQSTLRVVDKIALTYLTSGNLTFQCAHVVLNRNRYRPTYVEVSYVDHLQYFSPERNFHRAYLFVFPVIERQRLASVLFMLQQ